ncbi:MAG: adhesin [Flavobacteriaceae bacterium]|nr:adhesin [Flavobacteriaceae bacterium]
MALKNRETLKNYFKKGGFVTEKQFIDLIDSSMNRIDDGISIEPETGLNLNPLGDSTKLISFYKNSAQKTPEYSINLNDETDELVLQDRKNSSLLQINNKGNIGINNSSPEYSLDIKGTLGIKNRVGTYAKGSVPADGQWHSIIDNLDGIQAFEVVASVGGKINTGHYCLSHAIALSTFGGRGSKSKIKKTTAYYGSFRDKITYKWGGELHNYSLLIKTYRDYGEENGTPFKIKFSLSSLLDKE